MRLSVVAALAFSLLLPLPRAASADDAFSAKKRGDEAMDNGRPADALAAYVEAYALSKDPALLYNKGRALEALTEYPRAIEELEAFDQAAPPELKQRVPGLANMIAGLKAKVTTVSLVCAPAGARVRLRDRTLGTCPLATTVVVNAGKGTMEITADGHFPWTREIELPGGGVSAIDAHLTSKVTSGVIIVKSPAASAEVTVDGKPLGRAPAEASLLAGSHAIEVASEGYKPVRTTAVVTAGERREIDVSLEKESGILGKWWFWTGIGVVVAGGVVVGIALTTEKSPDKGTVAPGVVVGGLSSGRGLGFSF